MRSFLPIKNDLYIIMFEITLFIRKNANIIIVKVLLTTISLPTVPEKYSRNDDSGCTATPQYVVAYSYCTTLIIQNFSESKKENNASKRHFFITLLQNCYINDA